MKKSFDFIGVIEACGLTDLGFHDQKFTWCVTKGIQIIEFGEGLIEPWSRVQSVEPMLGSR
ncbi:hypothetical protein H5410_027675 [Solanum commersonii]|uniref:Uncharacterized protein n=1 Tax=Solanum commersonii TaxID=4109 RepID=A0A9J5Z2Q4_SOLCO|nr:hypothetical protein H5410_027675 [Solanum commersonii]